jgi:hypothetical protein
MQSKRLYRYHLVVPSFISKPADDTCNMMTDRHLTDVHIVKVIKSVNQYWFQKMVWSVEELVRGNLIPLSGSLF